MFECCAINMPTDPLTPSDGWVHCQSRHKILHNLFQPQYWTHATHYSDNSESLIVYNTLWNAVSQLLYFQRLFFHYFAGFYWFFEQIVLKIIDYKIFIRDNFFLCKELFLGTDQKPSIAQRIITKCFTRSEEQKRKNRFFDCVCRLVCVQTLRLFYLKRFGFN